VLLAGDSSTLRHGGGCAAPLTCTVMNSASLHHFAGRDRLQAGRWPQLRRTSTWRRMVSNGRSAAATCAARQVIIGGDGGRAATPPRRGGTRCGHGGRRRPGSAAGRMLTPRRAVRRVGSPPGVRTCLGPLDGRPLPPPGAWRQALGRDYGGMLRPPCRGQRRGRRRLRRLRGIRRLGDGVRGADDAGRSALHHAGVGAGAGSSGLRSQSDRT
jgi:hypothetical protein